MVVSFVLVLFPSKSCGYVALMNIKTMLTFEATGPTGEQPQSFRSDVTKQIEHLKIPEQGIKPPAQSFLIEPPQTERTTAKMAGPQEFAGKRSALMDCTYSGLPWNLGSWQHWSSPLQISLNRKHSPAQTKIRHSWLSRLVPMLLVTFNGN